MKLKDYLLISLFTFISPLIYGYYFGILDHHHSLPYINKLLNPNLYLNDYYFSQPQPQYSIFNYLIVGLKKITQLSLPWTHFLLYLITLWLLLYSIYKLALVIYKNKNISLLSVSFFFLPKWAAQIGYLTHQFYFVTRDLSLAVSILALISILNRRILSPIFLLIFAFIVNPLIPIPVGIFFLIQLIKLKNHHYFLSFVWIDILKKRGTYSFPHLWLWTGWGNFILFLSLLAASFYYFKNKLFNNLTKPLFKFIAVCIFLFLFQTIIGLIPVPFLIQFQFLRAINFIFILSLISFSALIIKLLSSQRLLIKLLAVLAALAVYFWSFHLTIWHFLIIWSLFLVLIIYQKKLLLTSKRLFLTPLIIGLLLIQVFLKVIVNPPKINLPFYIHYSNPLVDLSDYQGWFDLQIWARDNTLVTATFLTPPQKSGFRTFSLRSIIVDTKDGGNIFYSSSYAGEWDQRIKDLADFNNFSEANFFRLKNKYAFDYLVVPEIFPVLDFNQVYRQKGFVVYQL